MSKKIKIALVGATAAIALCAGILTGPTGMNNVKVASGTMADWYIY